MSFLVWRMQNPWFLERNSHLDFSFAIVGEFWLRTKLWSERSRYTLYTNMRPTVHSSIACRSVVVIWCSYSWSCPCTHDLDLLSFLEGTDLFACIVLFLADLAVITPFP